MRARFRPVRDAKGFRPRLSLGVAIIEAEGVLPNEGTTTEQGIHERGALDRQLPGRCRCVTLVAVPGIRGDCEHVAGGPLDPGRRAVLVGPHFRAAAPRDDERRGLVEVPVSDAFRAEFREQDSDGRVPGQVVERGTQCVAAGIRGDRVGS